MKIEQFNKKFKDKVRFVEISPFTRHNGQIVRRFNLEQWCPIADQWFRMISPGRRWHQNFTGAADQPLTDSELIIDSRLIRDVEMRLNRTPNAIMIVTEKHCVSYYDASSTEAIGLTCLAILRDRDSQNYYATSKELESEKPSPPKHKPEDFGDELELAEVCFKQWKSYEMSLKNYEQELQLRQGIDRALSEKDYWIAYHILESRRDYEYERIEVELLSVIEEDHPL